MSYIMILISLCISLFFIARAASRRRRGPDPTLHEEGGGKGSRRRGRRDRSPEVGVALERFFLTERSPRRWPPGHLLTAARFLRSFTPPPHPLSEGAPFYLLCSLLTRSSRSFGKAGRRRGPRFPLIRGNRAPFPPCNRPVRRTSNRRANIVVRSCRA